MRPLLLLLLVITTAAQAAPLNKAQWLLTGTDALEKIKQAGPGGKPSNIKDPVLRLDAMLAAAYALHAARPELVQTQSARGEDEFHIVIVVSPEKIFDLTSIYKADGSINGARLASLPSTWTIFFAPDQLQASTVSFIEKRRVNKTGTSDLPPPRPLFVNAPEGLLVFDLMDPRNAFVYERELNIPAQDASQAPLPAERGGGQDAAPKAKEKVKPKAGP